MEPTVVDGRWYVINLLAYHRRAPQRGDIVAIRTHGRGTYYLKRILACPHERIAFRNGVLYVNGVVVPEPYVRAGSDWNMPELVLQDLEYFVAGDNRTAPLGAHMAGTVRREKIVGKLGW